jgi:hypothetical protein
MEILGKRQEEKEINKEKETNNDREIIENMRKVEVNRMGPRHSSGG